MRSRLWIKAQAILAFIVLQFPSLEIVLPRGSPGYARATEPEPEPRSSTGEATGRVLPPASGPSSAPPPRAVATSVVFLAVVDARVLATASGGCCELAERIAALPSDGLEQRD